MKNDDKKNEEVEEAILDESEVHVEDENEEVEQEIGEEMVSREEYETVKTQAEQFEGLSKRMTADYQNLQRRVAEEKSHWIRTANKDLLLKLLPVLDTLILANKHINDKGLELSIDQFLRVLDGEGVKRIETVGKSLIRLLWNA